MAVPLLKKLNIHLPCDPAIAPLGTNPEEVKAGTQRGICTPMFTAALFTIAQRWKCLTCPSTGEWLNKMWHVHNRILFRFKKEGNLTHATTWMNLEDMMLSEISQSQKDKYCMITLI